VVALMPRPARRILDTLDGLAACAFVRLPELADYLGMPQRTLQVWCRNAWIPGARRRNPFTTTGDWLIPVHSARQIEVRLGLTTKRQPAA
jgi:hypothetical protein